MIENPQAIPDLEDKKNKEFLSLMGNILLDILMEKARINNPADPDQNEFTPIVAHSALPGD
jgi:hypothetical protein